MIDPNLMAAGMQAAGGVMGLATANWQDRRQLEQQRKLQELQMQGQRKMTEYNRKQAMLMWEDTNYPAQVKQLEKAGLNVGLMYGMKGGGGTTSNVPSGNVSGGNAQGGVGEIGMGLSLGMQAAQLQLLKAQKENIQADTQNKIAGAGAAEAGAAASRAQAGKTVEETQNVIKTRALLELEKDLKELEKEFQGRTMEDRVQQASFIASKYMGEAKSAMAQGALDIKAFDDRAEQIKLTTQSMLIQQEAMRMGIKLTEADIRKVNAATTEIEANVKSIITERQQSWTKLNYQERQIIVNEALQKMQKEQVDFMTSDPMKYKQWVDLLTGVVGIGMNAMTGGTSIKGFGK